MLQVSPAVPRAFALSGRFPRREGPVYIVGQLAATALGAALLRLLFGNVFALRAKISRPPQFCTLWPWMVLVTAILMYVIVAVATDRRAMGLPAGLAIGGAVALNVLWAGPISGASMNPARSFGPVLISGVWTVHCIYWVGPIIGAALGAFAYEFARRTEPGDV